jgi:hypothetical protein
MSDYTYFSEPVELQEVLTRIEALPPRAASWVDRQLEVNGDTYYDDAAVNGLVGQAEDLDEEALEEGDLPALFLTPEERLSQIRERIVARIPAYQVQGGGREAQLMRGEDDQSKHPDWYTRYDDRDTIEDRAAGADEEGRVLDENGAPMDGTWGWVVDHQTGLLLFFPEDEVTLQYPDGRVLVTTRMDGTARFQTAQTKGEAVVMVRTHHTTPVAGMPVTGAGLMTLQDGWIVSVTDESGHYQPSAVNQYEAMESMAEDGASFQRPVRREVGPDGQPTETYVPADGWDDAEGYRDARVHLTGSGRGAGGRPTGKAGWIDPMGDDNPYVPTGDLDLSAQQFETTEGNEAQIRLKAGLNAEFQATQAARLRAEAEGGDAPVAGAAVAGAPAAGGASGMGAAEYYTTTDDQGGVYNNDDQGGSAQDAQGVYRTAVPAEDVNATPAATPPANSLGEGYTFDPARQLFQQQDTGHYYSAAGELVYQWDPEQNRYYDHTTGTWM